MESEGPGKDRLSSGPMEAAIPQVRLLALLVRERL
jgi:hypothetical protein